jgi:4-aminobutyrate aminotransferase/(S)-3-amino-2-methylpropionate transaminase
MGRLARIARERGALLVADEIWTGLGRSGKMFASDAHADVICLGKGLGGGLPVSACVGRRDVMAAWSRAQEVVHTSTFAGAPAACSTAIATLGVIERDGLVERSATVGAAWLEALKRRLAGARSVREVRGAGLMIGIELDGPGAATALMFALLRKGYITSTGGGEREVLVLTPPLTIAEPLLEEFTDVLGHALGAHA